MANNHLTRVKICRDNLDWRSCKICASSVNLCVELLNFNKKKRPKCLILMHLHCFIVIKNSCDVRVELLTNLISHFCLDLSSEMRECVEVILKRDTENR